jgi:hypothetical protein
MAEQRLTWAEATLESIRRYCARHERNCFSRHHFMQEELSIIISRSKSEGKSPSQTLSRVLQELRDDNKLLFLESGKYLYIEKPVTAEETDLSDFELESLISLNRLTFSDVQTDEKKAYARQRKGQHLIRELTIANYNQHCALCDIDDKNLLIASHIARWTDLIEARGKLSNVICLCKIHDPLFENGYISLSDNFSLLIRDNIHSKMIREVIYTTEHFFIPIKIYPEKEYLQLHRIRCGFSST